MGWESGRKRGSGRVWAALGGVRNSHHLLKLVTKKKEEICLWSLSESGLCSCPVVVIDTYIWMDEGRKKRGQNRQESQQTWRGSLVGRLLEKNSFFSSYWAERPTRFPVVVTVDSQTQDKHSFLYFTTVTPTQKPQHVGLSIYEMFGSMYVIQCCCFSLQSSSSSVQMVFFLGRIFSFTHSLTSPTCTILDVCNASLSILL